VLKVIILSLSGHSSIGFCNFVKNNLTRKKLKSNMLKFRGPLFLFCHGAILSVHTGGNSGLSLETAFPKVRLLTAPLSKGLI